MSDGVTYRENGGRMKGITERHIASYRAILFQLRKYMATGCMVVEYDELKKLVDNHEMISVNGDDTAKVIIENNHAWLATMIFKSKQGKLMREPIELDSFWHGWELVGLLWDDVDKIAREALESKRESGE